MVFDGQWDDGTGTVVAIAGTTMTWPGGNKVRLATKSGDTCAFQRGHNTYEGVLMEGGNTLVWPGGVVWVRRSAEKSENEIDHLETPQPGCCHKVGRTTLQGGQLGTESKLTLD